MKQQDLLKREQFVTDQANKVKNTLIKGGCLAFDGSWGTGKSWLCDNFIDQIKEGLLKDQFNNISIIKIDASIFSHHHEPLMPIFLEFSRILRKDNKSFDIKQFFKKITPIISVASQAATGFDLGEKIDSLLTDEELPIDTQIANFKDAMTEHVKNKPLLFFIDELDRCTPDFALKFLDRIKHYFTISNIGFIIFVNTTQLTKYVKFVFGDDDGVAFLEKFIPAKQFMQLPSIFNPNYQWIEDKLLYHFYHSPLRDKATSPFAISCLIFLSEAFFENNLRKDEDVIKVAENFYQHKFESIAELYKKENSNLSEQQINEEVSKNQYTKLDFIDFYLIHLRVRCLESFQFLMKGNISAFIAREKPDIDRVRKFHQYYHWTHVNSPFSSAEDIINKIILFLERPDEIMADEDNIFKNNNRYRWVRTGNDLIEKFQELYMPLLGM